MAVRQALILFSSCWLLGVGCAVGLPGPNGFTSELELGSTPSNAGLVDGGSTTDMMPTVPVFMGVACERDTASACPCMDDTGATGMGTQRCVFDPMSPTMGSLGKCERCVVPMMAEPDAGTAGAAGAAGAAAAAAGMGGMGGSSGRGEAGSAGSSDAMACDPDSCPESSGLFGPREKCCTRGGDCGGLDLLGICQRN